MGVRISFWRFSVNINSAASFSLISKTIAGTVFNPNFSATLNLLSPSIISYSVPTFLNVSGCIIP